MRNSERLHHTLYPSGQAAAGKLLLLHPLASNGTFWNRMIEKLPGHVDVLTVDLRGHGQSPRVSGHWLAESHADDLKDILDHVGWSKTVIAGASMGGCVALSFVDRYPERVSGLGLIDTTAWYGDGAPERWRERALRARRGGMAALSEFQLDRWFSEEFRQSGNPVVAEMLDIFLANDVPSYESACRLLGEFDGRRALGAIDCPTTVIVGENDYATPPEMSRQIAAAIPGARLVILPKVRHFTPLEVPEEIAACLLPLVKTQTAGRKSLRS
ncbi:alpha/beta fold hydrolase [Pseudochelatococcus sp. B33]